MRIRNLWFVLALACLLPACVNITPGGSVDSSKRDEFMLKVLKDIKRVESPSVFSFSVDPATMATMTPEQLREIGVIARQAADAAKNTPKNTQADSTSTNMDAESESEYSERESLLIKAMGGLVFLLVVVGFIFVFKWFMSTPAGQMFSKAGAVASKVATGGIDFLEDQIEALIDKQRETSDPEELRKLAHEENRLRRTKDRYK